MATYSEKTAKFIVSVMTHQTVRFRVALSTDKPADDSDYAAYVDGLDITANDIFTICWTSGTTGQPKGVPRSHNMWMASGIGSHDAALLRDNEILLNPFPMVNMAAIGGFLYCWMMRACTLVLHHPSTCRCS